MKKDRIIEIDVLRAFSIIGVVAIHTLSYQLNHPVHQWIWNYLHFVEGAFVFSSGYVLFAKYHNFANWGKALAWIFKRWRRLLIPYYIFFLLHYVLFFLFPSYFNGFGLTDGSKFVWQSLFLVGGYNPNWLPVLFLELSCFFPVLIYLSQKKLWIGLYVCFALLATVFFTVFTFPYDGFRYVMWLPWSLVFLLAFLIYRLKDMRYVVAIGIGSGMIFFLLPYLYGTLHKSTVLIQNKYPPNIFYLSYEFFGILGAFFCIQLFCRYIPPVISHKLLFISKNSYQLYFVHAIILDFLANGLKMSHVSLPIFILFLLVLTISVLISFLVQNTKINQFIS